MFLLQFSSGELGFPPQPCFHMGETEVGYLNKVGNISTSMLLVANSFSNVFLRLPSDVPPERPLMSGKTRADAIKFLSL